MQAARYALMKMFLMLPTVTPQRLVFLPWRIGLFGLIGQDAAMT
jgi:hypothetical protein